MIGAYIFLYCLLCLICWMASIIVVHCRFATFTKGIDLEDVDVSMIPMFVIGFLFGPLVLGIVLFCVLAEFCDKYLVKIIMFIPVWF